jgi:anti-sigma factor RsiW
MTSPDPFRQWDAAYVLGALDPADRRAYEDHLLECDDCRAAVAELAGLPGVLRLLPADEAGAPTTAEVADAAHDADVVPLATLARSTRRYRRCRTTLVAAAAGVLLVGGVAGGLAAASDHGSPAPAATATTQRLELVSADASGVAADLTMTPRTWGTRLDWSCTYPAPAGGSAPPAGYARTYELVVVDADGTATVVATWAAHDGAAHDLGASTSVPAATIRTVEIRTEGSTTPLASAHT